MGYIYIFIDIPVKLKPIYFAQPPCRFTVRIRDPQELFGSPGPRANWNSRQDSGFSRNCSAACIA